MLRQLVNQFIHDRARPEIAAVGLNAVREICARCPLVMDEDLLQDLTQYKKSRDKPVSNAARGLIALFREIAPGLLDKKDRGKAADMSRTLKGFGEAEVVGRIDGVERHAIDSGSRRRRRSHAQDGPLACAALVVAEPGMRPLQLAEGIKRVGCEVLFALSRREDRRDELIAAWRRVDRVHQVSGAEVPGPPGGRACGALPRARDVPPVF